MSRGWYPDERDHAAPGASRRGLRGGYDAKTRLDLDAALELLRRSGLGPETTLVDLGCGTGLLATAASSEARRVVGVDPSPAMLDLARRRSDAVEWVKAGFLAYEHTGDPPQLVHSRNALHHLPDFWKGVALARVHDLLEPGGVQRSSNGRARRHLRDVRLQPTMKEHLRAARATPTAGAS